MDNDPPRKTFLSFIKRRRFWFATLIVILLLLYFYKLYSLAAGTEWIGLSWSNQIREELNLEEKAVTLHPGGLVHSCIFTLRKCISLRVDTEIHEHPELFVALIDRVTRPCEFFQSSELDEISKGRSAEEIAKIVYDRVRQRRRSLQQEMDRLHLMWLLRHYFGCLIPDGERGPTKIVLNVVDNLDDPWKNRLRYRIVKSFPLEVIYGKRDHKR